MLNYLLVPGFAFTHLDARQCGWASQNFTLQLRWWCSYFILFMMIATALFVIVAATVAHCLLLFFQLNSLVLQFCTAAPASLPNQSCLFEKYINFIYIYYMHTMQNLELNFLLVSSPLHMVIVLQQGVQQHVILFILHRSGCNVTMHFELLLLVWIALHQCLPFRHAVDGF